MRSAAFGGFFVLVVTLFMGCGRDDQEEMDVLARVGNEVITAEEFQLNYEFGHAHLRRGDDPKRQYLQYMIYEKIMAEEAERLGLDTAQAVVHSLRTLREEMLIERVFEENVLSEIEVTADEVEQAVNRSAVSFKFRFIPAFSEQKADAVYKDVIARNFDEVLEEEMASFRDLDVPIGEVTSPYTRSDEVDPAVLEVIQDLEIGMPSEPMQFGPLWYVFEVVDIRRDRLSEADYQQRGQTHRTRIFNQKAMEAGSKFTASIMEPRNVVTKRDGFEVLVDALWSWYSHETPARNLLHYIEEQGWDQPFTRLLVSNYDLPLVIFEGRTWTLRVFLEHFTPGRYIIRPDDRQEFRARLADVVALVVRDYVFLRIADDESLDEDAEFQRTVSLWKDKWMFQQFRSHIETHSESPVAAFVERYADSLATNEHRVTVDEARLEALYRSEPEKNLHMTVHLFKNNSNKQPFPIVDPNWVGR